VPTDRRGIQLVLTEAGRMAVERAEDALLQRLSQVVDGDMRKALPLVLSALGPGLDDDIGTTSAR
jgi:DNA-binding MarR family transcriptional regulator